jgi:hypothetical protein
MSIRTRFINAAPGILAVVIAAIMFAMPAHAKGGYSRPPPIEDLTQICSETTLSKSSVTAIKLHSECGDHSRSRLNDLEVTAPFD